jgi:hypothetical protein
VWSNDDREWRPLREKVLQRDGRACRNCGSESSLEVHHWLPLPEDRAGISRGGYRLGYWDHRIVPESALVTLCKICHSSLTAAREVVRLTEKASPQKPSADQKQEWSNIFQLWKSNGRALPMRVVRQSWNPDVDHYLLVEKVSFGRWPFRSAWGRYHREGRAKEQQKIWSAGAYQWRRLEA